MPTAPRRTARLVGGALGVLGAGAVSGAGLTAYAAWEARQYTLRRVEVPLLPPGRRPVRVLHLSDIHLTPDQTRKLAWLRSLAALEPDLVVDTGDNLSHRDAVPPLLDALAPLLERPGVFVHGSNDYFEPRARNPLRYLMPDTGLRRVNVPMLPWQQLSRGFEEAGWVDLTNRARLVEAGGALFDLAGVDDPHLRYERLDLVDQPAGSGAAAPADLSVAVAHAPYLRVLDHFAARGYGAILAGHTHGGQVCLPGGRALTTNCDLEPARARGLHRHPAGSSDGDPGSSWLHVSAGVGTNPYTRVRIACRPEATLLTLVPRAR